MTTWTATLRPCALGRSGRCRAAAGQRDQRVRAAGVDPRPCASTSPPSASSTSASPPSAGVSLAALGGVGIVGVGLRVGCPGRGCGRRCPGPGTRSGLRRRAAWRATVAIPSGWGHSSDPPTLRRLRVRLGERAGVGAGDRTAQPLLQLGQRHVRGLGQHPGLHHCAATPGSARRWRTRTPARMPRADRPRLQRRQRRGQDLGKLPGVIDPGLRAPRLHRIAAASSSRIGSRPDGSAGPANAATASWVRAAV